MESLSQLVDESFARHGFRPGAASVKILGSSSVETGLRVSGPASEESDLFCMPSIFSAWGVDVVEVHKS